MHQEEWNDGKTACRKSRPQAQQEYASARKRRGCSANFRTTNTTYIQSIELLQTIRLAITLVAIASRILGLPSYVIADLYGRRWHIETAFSLVKRLLGLAYLWTGSLNGIKLQIWTTWLFYAVLLDVADNVADELAIETEQISLEMLFRSFYHFNQAYNQGLAIDLIAYLVSPLNRDLALVKYQPKSRHRKTLDLSPYPV